MSPLLTLARVTVLLAFALLLLPLLRRQSAALRAGLIASALGAVALLPLLETFAPSWGEPIALPTALPASATTNMLFWLWAAGIAVQVVILLAGVGRLVGIAVAADPIRDGVWADLAVDIAAEYRVHAPVLLLEASRPTLPVTWGHREPKVLLPPAARDWSSERARIVLLHELAHVRRRDWLVLVGATLVRSLYWFHPLVWLACRQLRLECERACDDAVLRSGVSGARYASHLLELARGFVDARDAAVAPALARRSTLERRVRAMLAAGIDRSRPTGSRYALLTAMMASLTIAAAGFGSLPEPPRSHVVTQPAPRLTLLLDGRLMDLTKEWPTYPDPRAGIVQGPGLPPGTPR